MALRQKPKTESPPKEQTSAVPEELTRAVEMTYKPTTIKLSEIDDETKRPIFFHREKEVLAWSEEEEHESYLRSLAESLIKEGQITPIEFYRDEEGRPILVRGYLTVEAHRQIIARKLDPTHFHPDMEIKAAEISAVSSPITSSGPSRATRSAATCPTRPSPPSPR